MNAAVREWLPPGADGGPAVLRFLNIIVAAWSERWFNDAIYTVACVMAGDAARQRVEQDDEVISNTRCVVARLLAHGRAMLISQALSPEGQSLDDERDQLLLHTFVGAIVQDLVDRLDQALGHTAAERTASASLAIILRDSRQRDILSIRFSPTAHRKLIDKALPTPRLGGPLDYRGRVLGDRAVPVCGRVGQAQLELGALRTLALGDVVVLDRKVSDGIELITGAGRAFAAAELHFKDDRIEAHVIRRF